LSGVLLAEFNVPLSNHLSLLPSYVPGKSIEEVARELKMSPSEFVKLASNENNFGPSKKAVSAMKKSILGANVYPDGNYTLLKQKIALVNSLSTENVSIGNGSNELIELVGHVLLNEGDEVIVSEYCFAIYPIVAKLFKAKPIVVPSKSFGTDLDGMIKAITPKTKIIFIANPNNPTGTLVGKEKVISFLSSVPKNIMVVMDEAYSEYLSEPIDLTGKIKSGEFTNLIILRTFSKIYALAGLRVGYALAHPEMISAIEKVRAPFNINVVAYSAALASLDDSLHVKKIRKLNDVGIKYLEESFSKMDLPFVPSKANFVMVKVGEGMKVFKELQKEGVIIRPLDNYLLPEWVRITTGKNLENKKCIAALKKVLKK
jgi:histidinol-phosphate aminotransferase